MTAMTKTNPRNVKQAEVVRELKVDGVDGIHGVSFDGARVWLTDATRGGLVAVDGETGEVSARLPHVPADAGTAFDGAHLWQIAGGKIHKIDPKTGDVVKTIPAPGGDKDSGMTWADGKLWVGEYKAGLLRRIDPETGAVEKTLRSDRYVTGVTFAGGALWHGAIDEKDTTELRRVDVDDGTVQETLTMPKGTWVSGIEADGRGHFWCADANTGVVRKVRGSSR